MNSSAQQEQYVFRHLTAENGLINNHVGCIYQDHNGYIWIGTIDGLQRYDGNRFVNYLPDFNAPEALHIGGVTAIFEDTKHRFWIGSSAPYLLDRNTGKFYNYNLHLSGGSPVIKGVAKFLEDKNGDIWILSSTSFLKLNSATNQFEDKGPLAGITTGIFPAFLDKDNRGNIWFITTGGIRYYDPGNGKVFDKQNNPEKLNILNFDKKVWGFEIAGDKIFFCTIGSRVIDEYSFETNSISEHEIKEPEYGKNISKDFELRVNDLLMLKNGKLAITMAGEGMVLYDTLKNTYTEALIDNVDRNGLHGTPEMFVETRPFEDKDGNIWVPTNRGLNIFNPDKKHFYFYGSEVYNNKENIPSYAVNGFISDKKSSDIYLGFYYPNGGIMKVTSDFRIKKQYLYSKNGSNHIGENQLWCLYMDDDGVIWAPNQAGSILKLDTRNDQLTLTDDSALHGNINIIQKDSNGDLWLGTWRDGLKKIDHQTHRVTKFIQPPPGSSVIPKNILCLYFEGDSIIWVGSNGFGLLKFDKRVNAYTESYTFNETDNRSISSNAIVQILSYNRDTLIMSTNAGLNFFDRKRKVFTRFSTKDGLPGNAVGAIELDEKKYLWVSCDGGFCKLNLKNLFITRYGVEDGITENIINNTPFFKLSDGRWLVSGLSGFMAFRHTDITTGQVPPAPVISGFKVFDKNLEIDSLLNTGKSIVLSHKENNIIIEFASLQFNSSDKLKYYYQLDGVDKDWINAEGEQAVHYNHLKSGKYPFKVKCINRDGLSSENNTSLSIIIKPSFWQTTWFAILVFAVLASVYYLLYRWQQRRRKEKEQLRIEYEKKIAAVEMNTLRAQMNPHFIFNSLNSINTFILKNDADNAAEYLQKFSSLVRLILNNSRSEWILLENELKALELYIELESVRFENVFTHTISISPDVNTSSVWVPPLIIQPYVENAIRHGLINRKTPGAKLSINVWRENGELKIQVDDNGIGRQAAEAMKNRINKLHQPSHGMKISAERLDIVNDVYKVNASVQVTDLTGENNKGTGTRILLTIQYKTHADNNH